MSYLLGIGFAGSMLRWMIPPVGTVVLKSSAVIFEIYDWLCLRAVKLPSSRLVVGQPKWWQVVLCYIFMLMFLYFMGEKISKREQNGEKIQKSGVILILIVIMLISVPWHLDRDKLHIAMLDVGQGDGIFVKGPTGVTYFVDGGSSDVKNVGKYRIEPFLKSQGVGTVDYVFISHGDADHMNGIEEMLKRQQVGIRLKYLVLPEKKFWDENLSALADTAIQQGTQVLVIKEGEQIVEDGFSITCVLPQRAYSGEVGNASSMVLLLKYGSFDMLLTGDVEGEGEEVLESVGFPGGVDVLKVAHHGSKNSTSEEILKRLKPRIGLISAGIGNRYGHPNKETLERLKKNGVEIYNTQECGCIQLETDGVEMKKGTYFKFPIIVSTAFSTFSLQVARFTRTNVPKRSPPNQSP